MKQRSKLQTSKIMLIYYMIKGGFFVKNILLNGNFLDKKVSYFRAFSASVLL